MNPEFLYIFLNTSLKYTYREFSHDAQPTRMGQVLQMESKLEVSFI
jgi:hypothetical protein